MLAPECISVLPLLVSKKADLALIATACPQRSTFFPYRTNGRAGRHHSQRLATYIWMQLALCLSRAREHHYISCQQNKKPGPTPKEVCHHTEVRSFLVTREHGGSVRNQPIISYIINHKNSPAESDQIRSEVPLVQHHVSHSGQPNTSLKIRKQSMKEIALSHCYTPATSIQKHTAFLHRGTIQPLGTPSPSWNCQSPF